MKKQLPLILAVVLVAVAAGGGGVWYLGHKKAADGKEAQAKEEKPAADMQEYKYVSVDKVIVMLRAEDGTGKHYLSTDLVFKSPVKKEKATKEQIPLLRSIAVRALSSYSFEKAGAMTIDQIAADMNQAYQKAYPGDPEARPFSEVLIAKLIIE